MELLRRGGRAEEPMQPPAQTADLVSPFAVDFFAYPLRSVNGAPDSAGEAPGCPESPRQDPPTGAARGPTRSSAAGPEHDGYDVHAHLVDQARGKHLATDA